MNLQIAREANQNRMELAQYAYRKDLEMWQRMNEYNAPSAQMSRLQEAGLNPNLVYGTGTVTGNTSSGMPSFPVPSVGTAQVGTLPAINLGIDSAISGASGYLGIEQQQQNFEKGEIEKGIAQFNRDLKELDWAPARLKSDIAQAINEGIFSRRS